MKTVTIDVPEKERQNRTPTLQHQRESRQLSIKDGPTLGFATDRIRLYECGMDEYIELTNIELLRLLADAYGMDGANQHDE